MNSYLHFENLGKRYEKAAALDDVSFEVPRGAVLAVLGPNGAGKSTLFGCLLGFTRPTTGRVSFQNEQLTETSRIRFGYVSERVAVYPQRTVLENGMFFGSLKGHDTDEVTKQLNRVGLYNVRDRKVRHLSKGMLQRLGLAIALCGSPELVVLDEPFNGLDPALLDTLQDILRQENKRGATLLISTHTMSAIEPLATYVAILLAGRLVAFGRIDELREQFPECDSLERIYHQIARSSFHRREVCA